jgi:hypothetical protein
MRGTEIRQQLRNQSLQNLLTSTIKTVGERIFPDDMAVLDLEALNQIVNSWRSTHSVNYGQVLPNTGALLEGMENGDGITAGDNEVMEIIGISCANAGGVPIGVDIQLGDLILLHGIVDPINGITSNDVGALLPLTISKGLTLKFVVTSGTASDFSAKVAYAYRSI